MRVAAYQRSVMRAKPAEPAPATAPRHDPIPHQPGGRYGTVRRADWRVIAGIVALHGLALIAAIRMDVLPVFHKAEPTVVTLLPDDPPPPPPETRPDIPVPPVVPQVVAPPPIVRLAAPQPSPVTTVALPPPPQPVAVQAAPATKPGPPVAAAIQPPDVSGDQKDTPAPKYPLESRRLREQGTVVIRVLVTAAGAAGEAKVQRSSGFERLDKAALAAVRRWKFTPASQAGTAVAAWMDVPIPFVLNG